MSKEYTYMFNQKSGYQECKQVLMNCGKDFSYNDDNLGISVTLNMDNFSDAIAYTTIDSIVDKDRGTRN